MDKEIEDLIDHMQKMPLATPKDYYAITSAVAALKRLSAELEALKAMEPVAWRRRNEDFSGGWVLSEEEPEQNPANWKQLVIEPLYAGPQLPKIPKGWMLAPIRPTQAMCQAAQESLKQWPKFPFRVSSAYQAMLEVAPQPETKR